VIESSDLMTQQKTPGLDQTALQIGDVHVRNRGTIVEFCYTLIQGLIIRELSWRLKPPMTLKNQQGNVQLIRLFFYRALGNRSWRK